MSKQETTRTIPGIFPEDHPILKVRNADGSVSYRRSITDTDEVQVDKDDLESLVDILLDRIDVITYMMDDDLYSKIGFVYTAIISHARNQFYEIFHFLKQSAGVISCSTVSKTQYPYRAGRVLEVTIVQKEEAR